MAGTYVTIGKTTGRLHSFIVEPFGEHQLADELYIAIFSQRDEELYPNANREPSVVASTYPFTGDNKQKYYFGGKEILVPAYKSMKTAFQIHPDAFVLVTFVVHIFRLP